MAYSNSLRTGEDGSKRNSDGKHAERMYGSLAASSIYGSVVLNLLSNSES